MCTDVESSKKLKELGFKAKTDFYWAIGFDSDGLHKGSEFLKYQNNKESYFVHIEAYTLEQIIRVLPKSITERFTATAYKENVNYETLATTAAKLWIKLKESEIV